MISNFKEFNQVNRIHNINSQLIASEIIRYYALFREPPISYEKLAKKIGLSGRSSIYRYVNKLNLPTNEITEKIIGYAMNSNLLEKIIRKNIKVEKVIETILIDETKLLTNTNILKIISYLAKKKFLSQIDFDKIITTEVDGLPFAYALAFECNVPCLYLRRGRPIAVKDYYTVTVTSTKSREEDLFIPKKGIRSGERVLIVDDIIRSGKTVKAMIELVNKTDAKIIKILVLIAVNESYLDTIEETMLIQPILYL